MTGKLKAAYETWYFTVVIQGAKNTATVSETIVFCRDAKRKALPEWKSLITAIAYMGCGIFCNRSTHHTSCREKEVFQFHIFFIALEQPKGRPLLAR